jgi:hypothetical protein
MPLAIRLLLILALEAGAADTPVKITIHETALHQFEDGPALQSNQHYMAGELVFVSARFSGYTKYAKSDDEKPRVKLTYTWESLDPEGVPVVEAVNGSVDTELSPQDKDWMPKVRHDFPLPPLADPGNYKIVLTVKDEYNSATQRKEIPFTVRGHIVEPSGTLTVRNFRFLRTEDDAVPLPTPAYRPGDAVWARFDITGYKIGEKNRYSVSYGIEVLRDGGELLYREPVAAQQAEESFYRKRYMPGVVNVNPSADIAKGGYAILVRVDDRLSGAKHESVHKFRIE